MNRIFEMSDQKELQCSPSNISGLGDANLNLTRDQIMSKEAQMTNEHDTHTNCINKDSSMHRSESGFTTWKELKKNSASQLHRYPSGNNNTSMIFGTPNFSVRKSNSLPNLQLQQVKNALCGQDGSKSIMNYCGKMHELLSVQMESESSGPSYSPKILNTSTTSSSEQQPNPPAFNLVKLFIKQKTNSADTCMDVSSGCWPSDASLSAEQKARKKSMYDSGKGSALSKHEEATNAAEIQYDSLDLPPQSGAVAKSDADLAKTTPNQKNDLYRQTIESTSNRARTENSADARNQHIANVNNNNSYERESLKETMRSISDTSRTSDNITQVFGRSKIPISSITRSIQTSVLKQSFKVVPPSFLAQLNENVKSNMQQQAPVYVIYPNYALPDLGFVKNYHSQIVLSPLELKESFPKKRRPMSTADIEQLKQNKYSHVADWKSLLPLLPIEYKKMLRHVPDVELVYEEAQILEKPLFCIATPNRRGHMTPCDCSSCYTSSPGSSGASQPPSSGYAGSSTMFTDFDLPVFSSDHLRSELPAERFDLPPSGTPKNRVSLVQSKRNSLPDDTNAVKYRIDKRHSVQDYNSIRKMGSNDMAQKLTQFNIPLYDQTKENHSLIRRLEYDEETRSRVENFLANVPKSELKYYAEIANILESMENKNGTYDRNELKNQVSYTLAQKRVSFNSSNVLRDHQYGNDRKPFTTPPNSPNISITSARRNFEYLQQNSNKTKQNKIQSNRFKRLQIQWELLSKEAHQMENELCMRSRSGGSTPTSAPNTRVRSKIPRPVSYPTACK